MTADFFTCCSNHYGMTTRTPAKKENFLAMKENCHNNSDVISLLLIVFIFYTWIKIGSDSICRSFENLKVHFELNSEV